MQFQYVAIDNNGKQRKDIIEADSAKRARQQLRDKGWQLLTLEIYTTSKNKFSLNKSFSFSKKRVLSLSDLALFSRELANLVATGMPVADSLRAVAEQMNKSALQQLMMRVHAKVVEGYPLAKSLAEHPQDFPESYVASIAAGEQTGHLEDVLLRLADTTEKQLAIKQKIQQALLYPAIMSLVSIGVVIFLLTMVVPNMIEIFQDFDQALPTATVILLSVSDFLQNYGLYILIFIIAFVIAWRYALRTKPKFKFKVHEYLLKLPLIGNLVRMTNTAKFCRSLGVLSAAGVNMLEAFRISSRLVMNLPIQKSIGEAAQKIREGTAIYLALKQTGYFLPITLHVIANGEKSGNLEEMLQRAAEYQEQNLNRFIDMTLTIFEPVLILVMGSVVLFIVLAILLPMFEMTQLIA